MWELKRRKSDTTKYGGKHQDEYDEVEEEGDLEDKRSDWQDLPKNVGADIEPTVQGEGSDDRPR